ncbi:MAG: hypothetical protein KGL39_49030 [Patescibacteria group bacterium]|nr:hypothetical protein [Patescibacteria group bacterium]
MTHPAIPADEPPICQWINGDYTAEKTGRRRCALPAAIGGYGSLLPWCEKHLNRVRELEVWTS